MSEHTTVITAGAVVQPSYTRFVGQQRRKSNSPSGSAAARPAEGQLEVTAYFLGAYLPALRGRHTGTPRVRELRIPTSNSLWKNQSTLGP